MLQETTEWGNNTPNHIYYTDDSKSRLFGYTKVGTTDILLVKNRLFETKGRKFIAKRLPKKFESFFGIETSKNIVEVTGSKGDKYFVENDNGVWTCTCVGFRFQGKCKHITQVQKG